MWVENFITRPPNTFHTNGIFVTVHRILYVTFIYIMIFSCLFRCYKSHLGILLNTVNTGTQVVLTWKYYKQIYIFLTYEINSTLNILNALEENIFRYRATSRKVAGSIPDGVSENVQWLNPSGRTMVLGSTR